MKTQNTKEDVGRQVPPLFQHHEYQMDIRNLTRGQLTESYVELEAQRDELLAAAKQAYALFSSLLLSEPVEATVDGQSCVLRRLRAAIAKAEGGHP